MCGFSDVEPFGDGSAHDVVDNIFGEAEPFEFQQVVVFGVDHDLRQFGVGVRTKDYFSEMSGVS